jgi:hypothetical protein
MIKTPLLVLGIFCICVGACLALGSGLTLGLGGDEGRPGLGLAALFFFDVLVIFSFVTLALQVIGLGAFTGRVQFLTSLVVAIVFIFIGIGLVISAFTVLTVMLSLLLSVPFGTIVYFAVFGDFDTDRSRLILGLVMAFQIGGLIMVALAAPGILKNLQLMLLSGASVLFAFLLGFLHAFPPNFLVSIVDAIAAIVFGIVGTIWFLLLLFSGIASLLRTVRGAVPV